MTKDEALKLALEALEADPLEMVADANGHMVFLKDKAITAVKEALAQTQEPVAWGVFEGNLHDMFFTEAEAVEMAQLKGNHAEVRPLYTTPPQRKPLTENEIKNLWHDACQTNLELTSQLIVHMARNIEAAHGIKENT